MNKDLAEFAVAHADKLGAQYAEARMENSVANVFTLKNGVLEASGFGISSGLGIRLIVDGSLGFAAINTLEQNKIKDLVEQAVKIAKGAKILLKTPVTLSKEKSVVKEYEVKQKINTQDVTPDKKLDILFEIEKSLKSQNVPARYFSFSDALTEKYYVNSEGSKITSTIPRLHFSYFLTVKADATTLQRHFEYKAIEGWEVLKKWNLIDSLNQEAQSMLKNIKSGVKAPKEKVDLIASPEVVGIAVHESTGHPYEADRILGREAAQAGESFVQPSMIGNQIGSPIVTVVDDPTFPNSAGFFLFDDEGVQARRKFLMKNGKINEFLHNRETAAALGLKSNGSARACMYGVEPIVRMSNTFMLPGDYSEEELFEGVKKGVYIKSYMEWNIDDKRYNQKYVGNEAYLIEKGEIKGPVKQPVLEITTPAFYSAIDALSKKIDFVSGNCGKGEPMQGVPVWMGGPMARLRGIKLGGLR